MADFLPALANTLMSERYPGYVNDPSDKGGETVAGITRRDWPTWPGWAVVDHVKEVTGTKPGTIKSSALDRTLAGHPTFKQSVADFYRLHYWAPLGLDAERDQATASKVFDIAVWMGANEAKAALTAIGGLVA